MCRFLWHSSEKDKRNEKNTNQMKNVPNKRWRRERRHQKNEIKKKRNDERMIQHVRVLTNTPTDIRTSKKDEKREPKNKMRKEEMIKEFRQLISQTGFFASFFLSSSYSRRFRSMLMTAYKKSRQPFHMNLVWFLFSDWTEKHTKNTRNFQQDSFDCEINTKDVTKSKKKLCDKRYFQ